MRAQTTAVRYTWIMTVVALVLGAGSCIQAADSKTESAASASANPLVDSVFAQVYKGDFDAADKLVEAKLKDGNSPVELAALSRVLGEYKAIDASRQAARREAYSKQLAELKKYQYPVKGETDANGPKDINDVKDPNGLYAALGIVVRAHELADANQKKTLLEDSFVKLVIAKSLARCGEYERKGDWLESLSNCYGKLMALYEDNKTYSDYAQELTDKELVKLSLQDSPCETSTERYKDVSPDMLSRSIKLLDLNYVSILNYVDMSEKAVKRCQLLGEVIQAVPSLSKQYLKDSNPDKFAAWNNGLNSISTEITKSPLGLSRDKFIDIFEKIIALNDSTIKLPREIVIVHFSEAALGALDPYTNLIWPQQNEEFKKNMTNEFSGIGVEISKSGGPLKVASLLPDTPAYTSGIDADDLIEEINGESTKDMPIGCAVKKITGPSGTSVTLTIRRKGEQKTEKLTIKRAKIVVPTIRGWQRQADGTWQYMLDENYGIGYIQITGFSENTAPDLETTMRKLEASGLKGLIIDLRYNPGGYLETAKDIVDKFVEKGLIVRTQPRFGWADYKSAKKDGTHPDYPLAVLINGGSASASEIVAGALQDQIHKRALVVGTRSYGKGSVQTIQPVGDGAQLKYTMAYYHLPSGQRVEGRSEMEKAGRKDWGVGPDITVEMTSEELKKMIDVQRDNDVLVKAGHKGEPAKKYPLNETLASDPQLAIAQLVVKSKLIQNKAVALSK